jgi:NUMOD4 motif/HNH endonuclease
MTQLTDNLYEVETEIWADIKGYEGLYQISDKGRLKSLSKISKKKNGNLYPVKEKITIGSGKRYRNVVLVKPNTKPKHYAIHRLVAIHHVKGYKKGLIVNHINCNKQDNRAINLEWCSFRGNYVHAIKNGLTIQVPRNCPKRSFPVLRIDKDGNIIKEYPSAKEAIRADKLYGVYYAVKHKTVYKGDRWEYKHLSVPSLPPKD